MFSFAFGGERSQEIAVCCWETGLLVYWRLWEQQQQLNSFVPMSSGWVMYHLCHCYGNVLPAACPFSLPQDHCVTPEESFRKLPAEQEVPLVVEVLSS